MRAPAHELWGLQRRLTGAWPGRAPGDARDGHLWGDRACEGRREHWGGLGCEGRGGTREARDPEEGPGDAKDACEP